MSLRVKKILRFPRNRLRNFIVYVIARSEVALVIASPERAKQSHITNCHCERSDVAIP